MSFRRVALLDRLDDGQDVCWNNANDLPIARWPRGTIFTDGLDFDVFVPLLHIIFRSKFLFISVEEKATIRWYVFYARDRI